MYVLNTQKKRKDEKTKQKWNRHAAMLNCRRRGCLFTVDAVRTDRQTVRGQINTTYDVVELQHWNVAYRLRKAPINGNCANQNGQYGRTLTSASYVPRQSAARINLLVRRFTHDDILEGPIRQDAACILNVARE